MVLLDFSSHLCYISADLGGIIGLFLGGSAISAFEIFDVLFYNLALHLHYKLKKRLIISPSPKPMITENKLHQNAPAPSVEAWKE